MLIPSIQKPTTDNLYYVYKYTDSKKQTRYIGRGRNVPSTQPSRMFQRARAKSGHREVQRWMLSNPGKKLAVCIVRENLSKTEARLIESVLIAEYWNTGLLLNLVQSKNVNVVPRPVVLRRVRPKMKTKESEYFLTCPNVFSVPFHNSLCSEEQKILKRWLQDLPVTEAEITRFRKVHGVNMLYTASQHGSQFLEQLHRPESFEKFMYNTKSTKRRSAFIQDMQTLVQNWCAAREKINPSVPDPQFL